MASKSILIHSWVSYESIEDPSYFICCIVIVIQEFQAFANVNIFTNINNADVKIVAVIIGALKALSWL